MKKPFYLVHKLGIGLKRLKRAEEPTEYTPIKIKAGDRQITLALHLSDGLGWLVSDLESGARVLRVEGRYKGMPVSSAGTTALAARRLAIQQVTEMIERIGADRFWAAVEKGRESVRGLQ